MREPVRVGVVGAGYFSSFHCEAWSRLAGAELVAICDAHLPAARAMVARHPGAATFHDCEEMLDEMALDLLDVATPPATHASLCRVAMARGVSIVCQWTIRRTTRV